MARPRVTNEQIAKALKYTRGMVATAAHNLGIDRQTIYNRMAKSPGLSAIIEMERERMTDHVECKLLDAINANDTSAIKFYLATQGRGRGYVQHTETDLTSDGKRLEFTLNIGEAPAGEEGDEDDG